MTGWVYLVAASVPVLLLASSPHGLEEVHRLIFSTILGAAPEDLWVFSTLLVLTIALVARLHPKLVLFALDPGMATAAGMKRGRWNAAVALWLGLAVGLSIRVSGTLYTFGCLVLPALIAKNTAREIRPLLVLAPAISLAAALVGFVLATASTCRPPMPRWRCSVRGSCSRGCGESDRQAPVAVVQIEAARRSRAASAPRAAGERSRAACGPLQKGKKIGVTTTVVSQQSRSRGTPTFRKSAKR